MKRKEQYWANGHIENHHSNTMPPLHTDAHSLLLPVTNSHTVHTCTSERTPCITNSGAAARDTNINNNNINNSNGQTCHLKGSKRERERERERE